MKRSQILRKSQLYLKRNSPTILTCIGTIGVITTSILAVKATPKAMTLLEKAEKKKEEKLTKLEVVQVAGPVYVPSILVGASTIACIFGANVLNKNNQAALMSAYALIDSSYKQYKTKVKELFGEDADGLIRNKIAKDRYEEDDILVEEDKQIFFDFFSLRYFESTMQDVILAEYHINQQLEASGYVYLNEVYDAFGLPPIDSGYELGWSLYEGCTHIDFIHEKMPLDDGSEGYVIIMPFEPTSDYMI